MTYRCNSFKSTLKRIEFPDNFTLPNNIPYQFTTLTQSKGPSWGTKSRSTNRAISLRRRSPTVQHRVRKELPFVQNLYQINSIHISSPYSRLLYYYLSTYGHPSSLFLQVFPLRFCMHFSFVQSFYMPSSTHPPTFDRHHIIRSKPGRMVWQQHSRTVAGKSPLDISARTPIVQPKA